MGWDGMGWIDGWMDGKSHLARLVRAVYMPQNASGSKKNTILLPKLYNV